MEISTSGCGLVRFEPGRGRLLRGPDKPIASVKEPERGTGGGAGGRPRRRRRSAFKPDGSYEGLLLQRSQDGREDHHPPKARHRFSPPSRREGVTWSQRGRQRMYFLFRGGANGRGPSGQGLERV